MVFFRRSQDPLYGFLSLGIQFLHSYRLSDILIYFHVWFPDMPGHYLHMIPAFCTLAQIRTFFTDTPATLIFPVSGTVRCMIGQYLVIRAYIAVKIFIIHILIFLEKTFFGHWTLIWKKRCDPVIQKQLCYCRCFVSGIPAGCGERSVQKDRYPESVWHNSFQM